MPSLNDDRTLRARMTLDHYATYACAQDAPVEAQLPNLLADLMHAYGEREVMDAARMACVHHEAERGPEREAERARLLAWTGKLDHSDPARPKMERARTDPTPDDQREVEREARARAAELDLAQRDGERG